MTGFKYYNSQTQKAFNSSRYEYARWLNLARMYASQEKEKPGGLMPQFYEDKVSIVIVPTISLAIDQLILLKVVYDREYTL